MPSYLLPPAPPPAAAAAADAGVYSVLLFSATLKWNSGRQSFTSAADEAINQISMDFCCHFPVSFLGCGGGATAQNFGRDSAAAGALSQRLMRRRRHRVRMSINSGQLQLSLCSVSMSCGFTRLLKCPPSPLFCRLFLLPFRWRATYHFLLSCTNRHDVTRHLPQSPISPLYRQR